MSEICKFVHVSLFHYFCFYMGSPRSHYALFTSSLQRISFLSPLQRGAAGECSTQQPRFGVQQICLWRVLLHRVRWRALEGCILPAQYSDVKTFQVSSFSVPSQASVREGYSKGLAPASPRPESYELTSGGAGARPETRARVGAAVAGNIAKV